MNIVVSSLSLSINKGPSSLSYSLQAEEVKKAVVPAEVKIMERRIGCEMMLALMTLFHFLLTCVSASASGLTKLNNQEEQLRRNLLANGLGTTPPMGYVCLFVCIMCTHYLLANSFSHWDSVLFRICVPCSLLLVNSAGMSPAKTLFLFVHSYSHSFYLGILTINQSSLPSILQFMSQTYLWYWELATFPFYAGGTVGIILAVKLMKKSSEKQVIGHPCVYVMWLSYVLTI